MQTLDHQNRTIVFLGDSLTAGYGIGEHYSFPGQIARYFHGRPCQWKLVNLGISGDTTAGGVKRLPQALAHKPDILVLALGADDGLRGVAIEEIERNLRTIIQNAKLYKSKVVLAGMLTLPLYGLTYMDRFNKLFPKLAHEFGLDFVPFLLDGVALNPALNLPDGIHPNVSGAKVMAETVWKTLEPLVSVL